MSERERDKRKAEGEGEPRGRGRNPEETPRPSVDVQVEEPARSARQEAAAEEAGAEEAAVDDAASEDRLAEELRREVEELEELRDRHLRLAAEFENYRKRTRQELLKTREMAQADLVGRLLDPLDDLARVSSIPADSTSVEALHEGVALVERKLAKILEEAGLEPVEAEGRPFDPNLHEALVTVPTDDPERDDIISRVFVTGYRFGDRLVRPARVEVMKYRAGEGEAEGDRAR